MTSITKTLLSATALAAGGAIGTVGLPGESPWSPRPAWAQTDAEGYSTKCFVPSLVTKARANPAAAKKAVVDGETPEVTDAEARAAQACMTRDMRAGYAKSGGRVSNSYFNWTLYSTQSYQSATHGGRYVQNFGNEKAKAYGRYEQGGKLPVGAILAKDSFQVAADGRVQAGPLFIMEKMPAGWSADSLDWKYSIVLPDGTLMGQTRGVNAADIGFCAECHNATGKDHDGLLFLPAKYRVK